MTHQKNKTLDQSACIIRSYLAKSWSRGKRCERSPSHIDMSICLSDQSIVKVRKWLRSIKETHIHTHLKNILSNGLT